MPNTPIVKLLDHLIANDFRDPELYAWCDETAAHVDEVFATYAASVNHNGAVVHLSYVDHMGTFGYNMLVAAVDRFGVDNEEQPDSKLARTKKWLGDFYIALVEFDFNENHV